MIPNEYISELDYLKNFITGDLCEVMNTRVSSKRNINIAFISQLEPKKVNEALEYGSWVMAKELQNLTKITCAL